MEAGGFPGNLLQRLRFTLQTLPGPGAGHTGSELQWKLSGYRMPMCELDGETNLQRRILASTPDNIIQHACSSYKYRAVFFHYSSSSSNSSLSDFNFSGSMSFTAVITVLVKEEADATPKLHIPSRPTQ